MNPLGADPSWDVRVFQIELFAIGPNLLLRRVSQFFIYSSERQSRIGQSFSSRHFGIEHLAGIEVRRCGRCEIVFDVLCYDRLIRCRTFHVNSDGSAYSGAILAEAEAA